MDDEQAVPGVPESPFVAELRTAEAAAKEVLGADRWWHVFPSVPEVDVTAVFTALGAVTRRVRGSKMRAMQGFYDEFAAAWQFPPYFGENANAFVECMGDLHEWLPTELGYVVLVSEPEELLADLVTDLGKAEAPIVDLLPMFEACVEDFAEPVTSDDLFARPALSLDLVLLPGAEHRDRVSHLWNTAQTKL